MSDRNLDWHQKQNAEALAKRRAEIQRDEEAKESQADRERPRDNPDSNLD